MQVWIISGVAGIPSAFKATRRSREQRIIDEVHDRYERDMINLMFGWMMRLLIKIVFMIGLAPICATYTCISNLIKFFTNKKTVREYEDLLAQAEQSLNDEPNSYVEQQPQIENNISVYDPVQPEVPRAEYCSSPTTDKHSAYTICPDFSNSVSYVVLSNTDINQTE